MNSLAATVRGVVTFVLLALNAAFFGLVIFLLGLVKLLWPAGWWRRKCVLVGAWFGERWVICSDLICGALLPTRFDVRGMPGSLRRDGRYLIISNHLSATDVIVLFSVFGRKTPFIRFFLKRILIWIPLVGQGCWALEFPFMRRYSREFLERHPEKRGDDLETTRRACRHYRKIPVTVLDFAEGTRFTREKQADQASPYRHLLRPRFGGIAHVFASMGEHLDGMLDVTLAFPGVRDVTLWRFLCGRLPTVVVVVREIPLNPEFFDESVTRPGESREHFKSWLAGEWEAKDRLLDELLGT